MGPPIKFFLKLFIGFIELIQIFILMLVAALTRIGNSRVFQSDFRQQSNEHMTANVPGFRTLGDTGHVAADAFSKSVDGVGSGLFLVDYLVTTEALQVAGGLLG